MLELRGIEVAQDNFCLSANCAFECPVTALIGPSGAGKSTVLNIIAGFYTPKAGKVFWQGQDISGLVPAKRPVSILFQDNNLFPHLTIGGNLALALTTRRPSQDHMRRVEKTLAQVGLADMAGRKPAELSGGQQGRAALARVLLQDRPLMLLDEPFSALGPALRAEMLNLVKTLAGRRGIMVLMVSHAPEDAQRVAEQTALVSGGKLHSPQETQALFDHPSEGLKAYLGG